MDYPTQSNCNCNDCYFVKNELLQKIIHYIHDRPPIEPPVVIIFVHMTHIIRNISNEIFTTNSVLYVSIYINTLHRESAEKYYIAFEIKIAHNQNSPEVQSLLNNEMQFYKNIRSFVRRDLFPKCYFADNIPNEIVQRPIIVLENLMTNGYTIEIDILSKDALYKYMRVLGLFHAETFRMQANNPDNYRRLLENMRFESECQVKIRQEQAVSAFLNSSEMDSLNIKLKMEITEKLQKVKHLQMCTLSTIIHGCFTRDVVIMKTNITDLIITNFQKIRIGPPVIDFGRILFTNLPDKYNISTLQTFFSDTMNMYVIGLTEEYFKMTAMIKLLNREIYDNLLFSYINLENDERQAIGNSSTILELLNQLCEY